MPRFRYELADADDDADLRRVLAATPMEGAISILFAREPSYFAAAEVDGEMVQVGVVRDQLSGRIVGIGSRAISQHFVNGREQAVGYLSGLRLLPEYRGRAGLLARGYGFLRELHEDNRAPFYLTTIADDNESALRLLASQRARLPVYHEIGKYVTLAIGRGRRNIRTVDDTIQVRPAEPDDQEQVVAFLREYGPRRQFFPSLRSDSLFNESGRLRQLQPQDTLLAFRNDVLVGTLGFWNQSAFKQTIVNGYQPWLRMARPVANRWAQLRRQPRLPSPGKQLQAVYGAIPVVRDDDIEVFRRLMSADPAAGQCRSESVFLLGLCESDPLFPAARQLAARQYVTRLFVVYWKDNVPDIDRLVSRTPYLELGCL